MPNLPESDAGRSPGTTRGVAIRYLGQVGFLLERNGLRVVIDPFLGGTDPEPGSIWIRNYVPPVQPHELKNIDLVLCTHDHDDHTDPATLRGIMTASPGCRVAGPRPSVEKMQKAGLDPAQLVVVNEGAPLKLGGLIVEPVAAAHERYETDAEGLHRFLGYLLHWDGLTLYHAGDTVATLELERAVGAHPIDVGFLPINGRDEHRRRQDIVGNMDAGEAIHFAANLAKRRGFRLLVPTHYDLFKCNAAELSHFVGLWENTQGAKPGYRALAPGEQFVYERG